MFVFKPFAFAAFAFRAFAFSGQISLVGRGRRGVRYDLKHHPSFEWRGMSKGQGQVERKPVRND